ncbi:MAG TPA: hypothetical protein DCS63_07835 [Elusimicrobia bacterium]|nr:hypothetical protein [Elusimicrobiota bacterium]
MEQIEKDRAAIGWLTGAWDDYVAGFPSLIPVLLVQAAISSGSFFIMHRYHSMMYAVPYLILIVTPVSTGSALVYINMARGGRARLRHLFSAFPVYHRAIAISLWLGCLTLGGMLALVLPGIIIYLTYCFSEYALVDRRTGIRESFALSRVITEGWKGRLFPIFLLMMLVNFLAPDIVQVTGSFKTPAVALDLKPWNLAGALLKSLVFLPWLSLAMARAYNFLLTAPKTPAVPTDAPPPLEL